MRSPVPWERRRTSSLTELTRLTRLRPGTGGYPVPQYGWARCAVRSFFFALAVAGVPKAQVMTHINLAESDSVQWAVKTFRRKVQRSGILRELRKKRYYTKPSTAKRLKIAAARRRRRADARRAARSQ